MSHIFELTHSPLLPSFLKEHAITVLITTYQAGKLIVIGSLDGNTLYQTPISLSKPMGIAIQGKKMAVACLDEIRFFSAEENVHEIYNDTGRNYDIAYLQRATYHTGILDIHDLDFGQGMLWGTNTLLSCLGVYDINFSFRPKWKPPFISQIVPEDRCHLNGMALIDGLPAYVTALSQSDDAQGWRDNKLASGILMAVGTGEVLLSGLSMPHSPRMYQSHLYFLESGKGNLIRYNPEDKTHEIIFNFGCFIRGLSIVKDLAIIGKSKIRAHSKDFNGLPVEAGSQHAGILMFDLKNRKFLGEINYTSGIEEIYDVVAMADIINPAIVPIESALKKNIITIPKAKFWQNDSKDTKKT